VVKNNSALTPQFPKALETPVRTQEYAMPGFHDFKLQASTMTITLKI
jgi:hypothetical protein